MSALLFWFFSGLMLAFATLVILLRHPVGSALSLVVSFLALAALYVTLDAFFIGVTQVLVYAGAVMVLFIFIIMLLDLKTEERRKIKLPALLAGGVVTVGFVGAVYSVVHSYLPGRNAFPELVDSGKSDIWHVGNTLFSSYNLPFQVIGVLILVATIGVVVLSKKELK